MTALTASVLTLTAIACDRFKAVMFPMRARRSQNSRRLGFIIAAIWLVSVAAALPLLLYRHLHEIQVSLGRHRLQIQVSIYRQSLGLQVCIYRQSLGLQVCIPSRSW